MARGGKKVIDPSRKAEAGRGFWGREREREREPLLPTSNVETLISDKLFIWSGRTFLRCQSMSRKRVRWKKVSSQRSHIQLENFLLPEFSPFLKLYYIVVWYKELARGVLASWSNEPLHMTRVSWIYTSLTRRPLSKVFNCRDRLSLIVSLFSIFSFKFESLKFFYNSLVDL